MSCIILSFRQKLTPLSLSLSLCRGMLLLSIHLLGDALTSLALVRSAFVNDRREWSRFIPAELPEQQQFSQLSIQGHTHTHTHTRTH